MPRAKLSDRSIRALKTDKLQEDYWDTVSPGLGLRVNSTGKKTFFCRYRLGKSQRRMVLGDFPGLGLADARRKFRAVANQVDDGKDPQVEKQEAKAAETVADLFQIFFDDREGRISDGILKRYRGIYRREFEKPLGILRARDVRKAHVIPILRTLGDRAPTQCERAQELLQACFNHGVALDLLEFNPLHKLPKFGETRIGERYLSAEEVGKYLRAIKERDVVEETYFSLLILYGTRPGELAQWRWDWIKKDQITVPGEYQKNGRALILPLTPAVQRALAKLREETGHTPWFFPNPEEIAARQSFRKNKIRLEKKMKLKEPWTLRDIRRTTETLLRELKTPADVVSGILNHNTSHLRKIYDKSINLGEKRRALLRYEQYLGRLESREDKGKVVELASYRGA